MKVWLHVTRIFNKDGSELNEYYFMHSDTLEQVREQLCKKYGKNGEILLSPDERPVGYFFVGEVFDTFITLYTKPVKKVVYYDKRALNVLTGESIDIAPVQVATTYYDYKLWENR